MISGYGINVWLGRVLGPASYGVYGIVISLMATINLIQTVGLPHAISKYVSEDDERSDAILKSGLVLQIFSTIVICILYFVFAYPASVLLNDVSLSKYIRLSAFIFPAYGIYALYSGFYNGMRNFKKQALVNIIYSVVKAILIVALAYYFHLTGVIVGFIIAPIVTLFTGLYLPKNFNVRFPYKKLILFSLPLIGLAFFSNLQQTIDLFFIKSLLNSDISSGFYTANQNIARIQYLVFGALATVLFPIISKNQSDKETDKSKLLISQTFKILLILLSIGTLILSTTSKQILELLYSKSYVSAYESLSILIIGFAFLSVFAVFANILSAMGNPAKALYLSILGVVLSSVLCFSLIPVFGINGAAISTTISSAVLMLSSIYFVFKEFKISVPIYSVSKISIAALLTYAVSVFIHFPVLLTPLFYIILFSIYFLILVIFKEITPNDLVQLQLKVPVLNKFRRVDVKYEA